TGSGILAVASAKLGAEVDAVDIQEEAVKECIENSWENEVKINCEKKSVEQINKKYDVVLANLQIDIFRNVFDRLPKLFDKHLIVSGIFKNKERDEIINTAKKNKLKIVKEISEQKEGELWYGFVFEQIH
ncbi:MAG TPA: 50S ribosomal protein L11 methyltransferase, partial [Persephonella sp.]|nr:50S ribosomal protein L11 methyltransferase [Persephonella sp.]